MRKQPNKGINLSFRETKEMYKPLPDNLRLGFSDIHDIGLFAKENISKGTNFGMSHIQISDTLIRTPLGGFINHAGDPNCEKVKLYFKTDKTDFTKWNLITIKDIKAGEELTLSYTFYKI